jgi:hypothetical protein
VTIMNALTFFGLFFLVLAAVALHGWAANSQEADKEASLTAIPPRTERQVAPRRDSRPIRSPRPAAFRHVPSDDPDVVIDTPATPPVFSSRASATTTSTT